VILARLKAGAPGGWPLSATRSRVCRRRPGRGGARGNARAAARCAPVGAKAEPPVRSRSVPRRRLRPPPGSAASCRTCPPRAPPVHRSRRAYGPIRKSFDRRDARHMPLQDPRTSRGIRPASRGGGCSTLFSRCYYYVRHVRVSWRRSGRAWPWPIQALGVVLAGHAVVSYHHELGGEGSGSTATRPAAVRHVGPDRLIVPPPNTSR
jgi:hypothetical protein